MALQLVELDDEIIDEHICERYIELESRQATLKQDLGIVDSTVKTVFVDIEPPVANERKRKTKRLNSTLSDRYNLEIGQAITSLYSSRDNDNSTTGYVLWSTTPFFVRWLLYDPEAALFRNGGLAGDVAVPSLLDPSTAIFELGGGTSGVLPVVLGNYVGTYICSDQRGLINGMKSNIKDNLLQLNKRRCVSRSLQIRDTRLDDAEVTNLVNLEVMPLDWEKFQLQKSQIPYEVDLAAQSSSIYIIAMDVIYNDFLIDPFLKTLRHLFQFYQSRQIKTHCLIGIHMRSQDVVTDFLKKGVLEYDLPIQYIQCDSIDSSRFGLYFI